MRLPRLARTGLGRLESLLCLQDDILGLLVVAAQAPLLARAVGLLRILPRRGICSYGSCVPGGTFGHAILLNGGLDERIGAPSEHVEAEHPHRRGPCAPANMCIS